MYMTWNLNFFSNFEQYSFPASFWIHPRYFPAHHQYFLQYHQRYWLWYATHATHASKFFFLSRFSFTDTDDSQDSRGRNVIIFLFHSTFSTRSRTLRHFICNFASEMTITFFHFQSIIFIRSKNFNDWY